MLGVARRRPLPPRAGGARWPGSSLIGLGAKEITVLLVCLAGAALYPLLLFAFGGVTPAEARAAFRRRKGDAAAPSADLP